MAAGAGRKGVLCAGAMTVDHVIEIDHWPAEEGLAEILSQEREGGASTFNMAVDLRCLGFAEPLAVMGLVGDDADGTFVLERCRSFGVDTRAVARTRDAPTSSTTVLSDRSTGRRTFLYQPGTNHLLGPEHFDFATTAARLVHFGMPGIHQRMDAPAGTDANAWVDVFRRARAAGLKTSVELVSIAPERIAAVARPLLQHLDILVVNDVEMGALAGLRTVSDGQTDVASLRRAVATVMDAGPLSLVVAHFPAGSVALSRGGTLCTRPSVAVPQEVVKGTNGAGDAFAAGVLFGVLGDDTLEDTLDLAHASAAASLRALTTVGSIEAAEDALRLARDWGWRAGP
jgi:sugar/nucleoside kinase (ribokinase family)